MGYLYVGEGVVVLSPAAPTNSNALRNICFYQSKILVALVFLVCTVHAPKFSIGKIFRIEPSILCNTIFADASRYLVFRS